MPDTETDPDADSVPLTDGHAEELVVPDGEIDADADPEIEPLSLTVDE